MHVTVGRASAFHIGRVQRKLATGVYQTEPVACFCGETDAHLVTEKDRYGFDHPMWLCRACGLLYANPRMTESSYAEFYAKEYRAIYDVPGEQDDQFARGQRAAEALQQYLREVQDVAPSVVFDIGCNAGGWLKPFLDAGAEVHGVDYGPERVADGKAHGLPIQVGSIESLELMGKQADLIILNHVLEHATNLESMLSRVRELLKEDGILYVSVPGLLAYDLNILFQNAHPWQFSAETLTYVMECCGFEELRVDHRIISLWTRTPRYRRKADRPTQAVRENARYLFTHGTRYVPRVRCFNKFPKAQRRESVASATTRGLPEVTDLMQRHTGREALILCGGPSIDGEVETIRRLHAEGRVLLAIERMYPWCQSHGITPDYVVIQDASADVTESLTTIRPGTTFLVSSQCPPAVFDALAAADQTYFFHSTHDLTNDELAGPGAMGVLMNAGGSVSLGAFTLAMLMGLSTVHLFGFDCHVTTGSYAQGIAGVGEQADFIQVKIDGRAFRTTPAYLAFAQQFFELCEIGKRDALLSNVTIHGDSLATAMSVEKIGA